MTTLVARHGILASDTRSTYFAEHPNPFAVDGHSKIFPLRNIIATTDGRAYQLKAIAFAGNTGVSRNLLSTMQNVSELSDKPEELMAIVRKTFPHQFEKPSFEFIAIAHCGKVFSSKWKRGGGTWKLTVTIAGPDDLVLCARNVDVLREIDKLTGKVLAPMDIIALARMFDEGTGGCIQYVSGGLQMQMYRRPTDEMIKLITDSIGKKLADPKIFTWEDLQPPQPTEGKKDEQTTSSN